MYNNISFSQFIGYLQSLKLVILGEIHGTKEIPKIEEKIIKALSRKIRFIFLEIPKSQQKHIDRYLDSDKENYLAKIPFFKNPSEDGRGSKENLLLIKSIKVLKRKFVDSLKIVCVDPDKKRGNRDLLMAKEVTKHLKKNKGDSGIFISGNFHARKDVISIKGRKFVPCGHHLKISLKKRLASVNIAPKNGSFYNFGVKKIQNNFSKVGIFRSKSGDYDFYYTIKKASPCSFLRS